MALTSDSAAAMLNGPPMPSGSAFAVAWQWFLSLQEERQSGGMGGPQAFSSQQMLAWEQTEELRLPLWAKRCLRRFDSAFLRASAVSDDDLMAELQKMTAGE